MTQQAFRLLHVIVQSSGRSCPEIFTVCSLRSRVGSNIPLFVVRDVTAD